MLRYSVDLGGTPRNRTLVPNRNALPDLPCHQVRSESETQLTLVKQLKSARVTIRQTHVNAHRLNSPRGIVAHLLTAIRQLGRGGIYYMLAATSTPRFILLQFPYRPKTDSDHLNPYFFERTPKI